ncbi:low temperature requirement protein A [Mycobacteroides abscessus]|uniref:low temperature requirement protein A n=1 Tax=Mycobacteroides abscessus TaxID=36809 RepID=UPI0005E625C7|nr:low temperature requirement protein A [Mycobacteroides abscessus]CPR61909.1 Probable low temperature requirement protein A [Mycobacteroides abscessus]CPS27283.1 Probable low temperature requirement protein A [Mycobacteroides abscessus]CPY22327.1 Probable low temperature requirement protein A [Mycobacteroides abscessus]CPY24081.1 Probable low temperature requirement protein A [Mycobacteroides abscessus]SLI59800.1 low temperature requirement protein LtrA [Mycobacteroides abscessus subsp. absc
MIGGLRAMVSRDPAEPHRASTPLELLFDLVFVVAVSRASGSLHHFWAEGHFTQGLIGYAMGFFAIWWAWMNFTWFASAFDTDDWLYRLTTLVQMAGALTIAAGVERAMTQADFGIVIGGYVLMRVAAGSQWLRAAVSDPAMRATCLRYAAGIAAVQAALCAPEHVRFGLFIAIALADMSVPLFAERVAPTTWHPVHIAERYGLFTLIVLGESILASANSIIGGAEEAEHSGTMISIAVSALTIVAAVWWIYFDEEQECEDASLRASLLWGYSHYFIFASVAAISAGFEVAVDQGLGKSHLSATTAALTITVPFAIYLVLAWLILLLRRRDAVLNIGLPAIALAAVAISSMPHALYWLAGLAAVAAALVTWRRVEDTESASAGSLAHSEES